VSFEKVFHWLCTIVALCLSAAGLYLQFFNQSPKLKVLVVDAHPVSEDKNQKNAPFDFMLRLEFANDGKLSTSVSTVRLFYKSMPLQAGRDREECQVLGQLSTLQELQSDFPIIVPGNTHVIAKASFAFDDFWHHIPTVANTQYELCMMVVYTDENGFARNQNVLVAQYMTKAAGSNPWVGGPFQHFVTLDETGLPIEAKLQ
jgi:hypothetical protein